MRSRSFLTLSLRSAAAIALVSTVAQAQSRTGALTSAKAFDVTPYVGYMVFGDYMTGPLGTSLSNAPAPVYGAQLGMHLTPSVSIVGNLATSSSSIKAGIPFIGGISVADSRMVMYDAGLQLDLPVTSVSGTRMSPFLQAGAGAMRYDITQSFINMNATNFAANVGLGADVAINKDFGLRLMARDYIGKFDFKDATFVDFEGKTAHNFAFSGGVRVSF